MIDDDAPDQEEVTRQRKETEAQRKKRIRGAVERVLADADGRTVLAEILGFTQIESINALDGPAAFRTEGARTVGLQIRNLLISNDPAGFLNLYREIHLP